VDLARTLLAAPPPAPAPHAPEAAPAPAVAAPATSAAARIAHDGTALLAAADLAGFAAPGAAPMQQLLHDPALVRHLDDLRQRLLQLDEGHRAIVATSLGVTGGLSIGYVVWLVRGGVLVSSMLSALPAWQMIDPLPVLASARPRGQGAGDRAATAADRAVERLFDERAGHAPAPAPAAPTPDPGPRPAAPEPPEPPGAPR
jgi:hypothetical protein